jgi:mono/diheme cytochrome c family protein
MTTRSPRADRASLFTRSTSLSCGAVALGLVLGACADGETGDTANGYASASLVRGGQLYDQWWSVPQAKSSAPPAGSNPGYAMTTGMQTGAVTFRCKECHGWDYRGTTGAYASGSHATGSPGILGEQSETPEALFAAIKGGVPATAMSAYGAYLSDTDIWDLVKFIREGLVDTTTLIDAPTRAPVGADAAAGATRFASTCALASCHGAQGNALNFGDAASPEYVGTIAVDNPWEFIHKVRVGHPGSAMPSSIAAGWSTADVLNVLAHARTLPTE